LDLKHKTKLSLGAAQFGLDYGVANKKGKILLPDVIDIVKLARESGVTLIDTAMSYGDSEAVLGQAGVSDFEIVTKIPSIKRLSGDLNEHLERLITQSLLRLNVQTLYGILLHDSSDLGDPRLEEFILALNGFKRSGVIKKIGISVYSPSELDVVYDGLDADIVQLPLNLVDRRFELSGDLNRLKKLGVEIHSRSAFLQGLLLLPRADLGPKFQKWSGLWGRFEQTLAELGDRAVEVCLGYPMSLKSVDRVIVGVDSTEHLTEILRVRNSNAFDNSYYFMSSDDETLVNPSKWNVL